MLKLIRFGWDFHNGSQSSGTHGTQSTTNQRQLVTTSLTKPVLVAGGATAISDCRVFFLVKLGWDRINQRFHRIPSGKHLQKTMGKLTISMVIFNSELLNYQRVPTVSDSRFERIIPISWQHLMRISDIPVDSPREWVTSHGAAWGGFISDHTREMTTNDHNCKVASSGFAWFCLISPMKIWISKSQKVGYVKARGPPGVEFLRPEISGIPWYTLTSNPLELGVTNPHKQFNKY